MMMVEKCKEDDDEEEEEDATCTKIRYGGNIFFSPLLISRE
jgi:hypothetical protein